jgi:hypothetical protein
MRQGHGLFFGPERNLILDPQDSGSKTAPLILGHSSHPSDGGRFSDEPHPPFRLDKEENR